MAVMVYSRIFGILSKLIVAMIPKHDLTIMICSPIMQIYKNIGGQKEIVSKVELQLNVIRFKGLKKNSTNSLTLSPI
jgi:hypothetical protein